METVVKAGHTEELKHLPRLQQWRVDVPHHGGPSRSQGLTTRSAILAEDCQERDFSRKLFLTADVL